MNQPFQFPLNIKFKITTFSNDFTVKDHTGKTIFYIREKMFKLRDHINVFKDETKQEKLYDFISNKIIDFQQTFTITDHTNRVIGKVRKKTLKSFINLNYHIQDIQGQTIYTIQEKNALVRIIDNIIGEIPLIGILSCYLFHPKYIVKDNNNKELYALIKRPSLLGRKFTIQKLSENNTHEEQIILSLMLLTIKERDRG